MNPLTELKNLTGLFSNDDGLIALAEHVPSSQTPEPYKQLLVHEEHMTVTMEAFHRSSVSVKILDRIQDDLIYARKILLTAYSTGKVVQFGIVRFDLSYVTKSVRREILSGKTPLGRILINHNVLRHIDLGAILRISPGPELQRVFGDGSITYGRLATIFCNQQPAVDLLEVSVPLTLATL